MSRTSRIVGLLAGVALLSGCSPYLIFATGGGDGQPACDRPELEVVSADLDLRGRIHSNEDLVIGGEGSIDGIVSSVGDALIDPGVVLDPDEHNPLQLGEALTRSPVDIDDYRPGGSVAALAAATGEFHDFTGTDVTAATLAAAGLAHRPPGVYYTDGDITVGIDQATLVAEGRITGHGGRYWPDDPGQVYALSAYVGDCTTAGITITGGSASFIGRLVAPNAGVTLEPATTSCSYLVASTEIVAAWVQLERDEIYLGPLPALGEERFLVVGCPL